MERKVSASEVSFLQHGAIIIIIIYLLRRSSKTAPEHKRHTYNTLKRKQYTEIKQ